MITQERLKELVNYDPITGIFTWRINDRCHRRGKAIGSEGARGLRACLDWRSYRLHRLAWMYVHGEWPKGVIDHINGDWRDNRIANLRDVSQAVNMQNQRQPRSDSTTGLLGVRHNGRNWMAVIQKNGKQKYLGTYHTPEQAHAAYVTAKRILHEGCTL